MEKGKQTICRNRIVLTIGKLTRNGVVFNRRKFSAVEKAKSYWLDGGQRRVSKDKMLVSYTRKANAINVRAEIEYQVWCFKGQEEEAKRKVISSILDCFMSYHNAVNTLQNGVSKFVINEIK